ncbi:MAG: hypothetical protein JSS65_00020 [Armatimonadetes bacterium]|nr:hypothetical protein [Armatimonadota bacterium]
MLSVVYSGTVKDFLRPGRVVAWTAAAVVIGVLARVWVNMHGVEDVAMAYGEIVKELVFRFVALAAAIFAPMVVSQEVEQKTIVYLLTRAVPRPVMLLGRLLAAFTATSLVAVLVNVCAGVGVMGPSVLAHRSFLPDMGLAILGAASYCSLFVMLSLLVNKALVWCLLFAFGWETFVPAMAGMAGISIRTHLANLQPDPKRVDEVQNAVQKMLSTEIAPAVSWTALLGSAFVLAGLAAWWFSLKEFAPREDSD